VVGRFVPASDRRYPLAEDDRVRSQAQTTVDLPLGNALLPRPLLRLDLFNLFDSQTSDIAYFYDSRLPGEPAEGVGDVHFHPAEPRSFRVSLSYRF
jgi:hypothetical protein